MARDGRTLPGRRQRDAFDESVLVRSAETLGRMIGSLQRQLDGAAKKLAAPGNGASASPKGNARANKRSRMTKAETPKKPSRAAAAAGKGAGNSGVKKVRSTADRKSKRASKSAAAKKAAGAGGAAPRKSKRGGSAS